MRPGREAHEIDRWCELANIGAGHAAGALANFFGHPIRMRVPRVRLEIEGEEDRICTGIFFEVEGEIRGELGVFFSADACRELVESLLGESSAPDSQDAQSVLSEVANVVASQALSAVADLIGGRVMPSLPILCFDHPERVFEARLAEREPDSPLRIENLLVDENDVPRGAIIWGVHPGI